MFQCGQWIHVRDDLSHEFAGFDGQVVANGEDTVVVEIYDLKLGAQPSLFPRVCEFGVNEVNFVSSGHLTTYEVLQQALQKWNRLKAAL